MKTRTGKIARLPKLIREQLNQRLENGELGTSLVEWLNHQPEVQKILTDQFAGLPIRPQNLSEWRKGGYLEWLRHQLLREQTRWTAEQAADLDSDAGPVTMSIAEDIALIMSAELALQVQALGDITDPKERFEQFRLLTRELSRLRRDDQRALRTNDRRDQWSYDHPQKKAPVPKPEPAEGEARSPKPYIPTIDELQRLRLAAHFRQAGTPQTPEAPASPVPPSPLDPQPSAPGPLPLSQSETKQENPSSKPEPIKSTESTSATAPQQPPYNPPLPHPSPLSPLPSTPPSPPIRPNPNQNNDHDRQPTAPASPTPKQFTSPHRDYYDPRPPIRGRRPRYLEG